MRFLLLVVLIAASATSARAQGVNLRWDDCAPGGSTLRQFSCDTNTGLQRMVASYRPPAGVDTLLQVAGIVDLCFDGAFVPDWWQMKNSGTCRQPSLTDHVIPPEPVSCAVRLTGNVAKFTTYQVGYSGWDDIRIVVRAIPLEDPGTPLDPGQEYFAFALDVDHQKTTGPDACAGCALPACIVLNGIELYRPGGTRVSITNPDQSYMLNWQSMVPNCPFIVPARRQTWGGIKALYR